MNSPNSPLNPKLERKSMIKKWFFLSLLSVFFFFILLCFCVSYLLLHPNGKKIERTPEQVGLSYQNIQFNSYDELTLKGWFIKAPNDQKRLVIFAHGYTDNRSHHPSILPLAKTFYSQNVSSLLFDFRNSGLSEGSQTTLGYKEKYDLLSAIQYAKQLGYSEISLIGFSMGASTSLLAAEESELVMSIVSDSAFSDLHLYLSENLTVWSKLPKYPFTPIILKASEIMTGFKAIDVQPISAVDNMNEKPILFIHSEKDLKIPSFHSKRMYQKTTNIRSELWITPGNQHVGSFSEKPNEYIRRVVSFVLENFEK